MAVRRPNIHMEQVGEEMEEKGGILVAGGFGGNGLN